VAGSTALVSEGFPISGKGHCTALATAMQEDSRSSGSAHLPAQDFRRDRFPAVPSFSRRHPDQVFVERAAANDDSIIP
jgi:hypothetical protein